jgi:hypothetical protein
MGTRSGHGHIANAPAAARTTPHPRGTPFPPPRGTRRPIIPARDKPG